MADVHSRFIPIQNWYDGHRLDPGDLDLPAYIDARIAANQNGSPGGSSYLVYDSFGDFPATGETGKVYLALDEGYTYKWDGSEYVGIEIGYFRDNDNNGFFSDDGVQGLYFELNTLHDNGVIGSNKLFNITNEYDSFYEENFAGNHYKEAARFYHEIISVDPALKTYVYADNEIIRLDIMSTPGDVILFSFRVDRITGYKFSNLQEFADNAAAISGGLPVGGIYHTAGAMKIVIEP